jgi:hypothetical protein
MSMLLFKTLIPPAPAKLTTCVTPVRGKKNLNLRKKSEIELGIKWVLGLVLIPSPVLAGGQLLVLILNFPKF